MTLDPAIELRATLGCFATGVTIVTAPSDANEPVGLTVSSFNSVSLDPPLVLFSLARSARSLDAVISAPAFAVNVLAEAHEEISNRFARPSTTKWEGMDYEVGHGGAPLIPGAMATFECEHHALYDGGDHAIVVGRVIRHRFDPEQAPLVFFRGRYHAVRALAV